jgi:hypothetical protein
MLYRAQGRGRTFGAAKEVFMTTRPGQFARWPTLLGTVACLVLLVAGTAQASIHYGIILTTHASPQTTAYFTIGSDQEGAVVFTVFPAGVAPVSDTVMLSEHGFATSADSTNPAIQNLFTGSGATTALVRAVFEQGESGAVLEQSSHDGTVVVAVPPVGAIRGVKFFIPIGDLQHGTSVIVGNPSDQETFIVVRYGNSLPEPPRLLERFSTLTIDVPEPNTLMTILSTDEGGTVIAALVVDTGKTTAMTYLASTAAQ